MEQSQSELRVIDQIWGFSNHGIPLLGRRGTLPLQRARNVTIGVPLTGLHEFPLWHSEACVNAKLNTLSAKQTCLGHRAQEKSIKHFSRHPARKVHNSFSPRAVEQLVVHFERHTVKVDRLCLAAFHVSHVFTAQSFISLAHAVIWLQRAAAITQESFLDGRTD